MSIIVHVAILYFPGFSEYNNIIKKILISRPWGDRNLRFTDFSRISESMVTVKAINTMLWYIIFTQTYFIL